MTSQKPLNLSASRGMHLLRTKLNIPHPHADRVERPWLIHRLETGLKARLIVVSAPAGSGKTTLVSVWAGQCKQPVTWVSLDERDNDPVRFWAYFISSLQTLKAGVGESTLSMLQSPQPPPIEMLLHELLEDIETIPNDFYIVLDDFHIIKADAIHAGISYLVDHLPAQVHLVISGREAPPLPLPQLRVRRELVEINPADLRFNVEEAGVFFTQVMKLDISPAQIQTIETLTEGWVAGLQLAALSIQELKDIPAFIQSFTGSHRYVFDYLAQEVLDHQPEDVRQFLLQTSILDRLNGALCDSVMEISGSQAMLENLEKTNLFIVPLDSQRQWYRYHHLFGEFLQTQLNRQLPTNAIVNLYQQASLWHEQHNLVAEAIHYALHNNDFQRAAILIERTSKEMFERSELITLRNWLSTLPADFVRSKPALNMLFTWVLLATGQHSQVKDHLDEIETALGTTVESSFEQRMALSPQLRGALGEVAVMRANITFHRADFPAVLTLSEKALGYLTDDVTQGLFQQKADLLAVVSFNQGLAYEFSGDLAPASAAFTWTITNYELMANNHLWLFASSHQAQVQMVQARLSQAVETLQRASQMVSSQAVPPSPIKGIVHAFLGQIYYEWNDLEQADMHFNIGVSLGSLWSNWETLLPSYLGLVHIKAAQQHPENAQETLDQLYETAHKLNIESGLSLTSQIDGHQAALWVQTEKIKQANHWVNDQQFLLKSQDPVPSLFEPDAILFMGILNKLNRPEDARRLGRRMLPIMETGQRWARVIATLAQLALAAQGSGETQQAIELINQSLKLAESAGYLRLYLDSGTRMASLMKNAVESGPVPALARRVLLAFEAAPGVQIKVNAPTPSGPISERELEVVRLLAKGMSNQEIAAALYLSPNTVKTHLRNIMDHLDANNRTQAVVRARELGLI